MLPAPNRLRKTNDINRVYKRGVYGAGENQLSVKALATGAPASRVVIVVSKKIDKRAVVRNTIRRRLSGALEQMWATVPAGYDIVVSVHADVSGLPADRLRSLVAAALTRAKVIAT